MAKQQSSQKRKGQPAKRKGQPVKGKHTKKVPAEDAIVKMTLNEDATKVFQEMAAGWDDVLPQTEEEDPGCLIMWEEDNLSATVTAFNAAIAEGGLPHPPEWLVHADGRPISVMGLETAILTRICTTAGPGVGGVVGNAMIAPNTLEGYKNVGIRLFELGVNAFFAAHTICPLGKHFIVKDMHHKDTATEDPIVTHLDDGVAPVFA